MVDEVRLHECPCVGRIQYDGARAAGSGPHRSRLRNGPRLPAARRDRGAFYFAGSRVMVLCQVQIAATMQLVSSAKDGTLNACRGQAEISRRVRSTVAARRGDALSTGDATSSRPLRSSFTAIGCGAISITPSRQRTSSATPGSKAASRRISLGITRRPAESMVVVMVAIIPLIRPSGCPSALIVSQCADTACCFQA